ncbi:hypothetical protein RJT34_16766 [Clitoria ternatea]|uniref:Uncharacterized protein n=1 Tax=Clitoria ternatea TaxID=43366 RepID=A0AAN9JAU6_CLITE
MGSTVVAKIVATITATIVSKTEVAVEKLEKLTSFYSMKMEEEQLSKASYPRVNLSCQTHQKCPKPIF